MKNRISGIRKDFVLEHPFLGDLSLNLRLKEDAALTPTMGTDMRYLYYNPDYIKTLDDSGLRGVICHEIGHSVFRHAGKEGLERMGAKIETVWRIAAEYMANHFVIDICGLTLPGKYCYSKKYATGKWTTELVYHDLLKNMTKEQIAALQVLDDHSMWGNAQAQAGDQNVDNDWKVALSRATQSARMRGKLPAGIQELVDDILDPVLPWRMILANVVTKMFRNDYTWRKPSRRHLWRNLIFPSLHSDSIEIGYATDTSGSISTEEMQEGFAELRGIMSAFPSYKLHLFACDAEVQHYQVVGPHDEVDIEGMCRGRGGTDFRPVFNHIEEHALPIDALVYFTDAYGSFPAEPPQYPVIWVVKGPGEVEFGTRIQYDA